jgi:L-ribulose-5-phosphate 3-epimerase
MNKIGVFLETFKCNVKKAVEYAVIVGVDGVQFYSATGELDCDKLKTNEKAEFYNLLKKNSLEVSAICADFGGYGFVIENDNAFKIAKTQRVMDFALELNCNIITTHIGIIPNLQCKTRDILLSACRKIGEYGKKIGVKIAIETGSEKTCVLKDFLDELNIKSVGVNFDPANLVMVADDNPLQGVRLLKDYIFHTHVKDGVMLKKADPAFIYDIFAKGVIEDYLLLEYFKETALGEGSVNISKWLEALKEIGYDGYLTIERETSNNPLDDIKTAINYIKSIKGGCL